MALLLGMKKLLNFPFKKILVLRFSLFINHVIIDNMRSPDTYHGLDMVNEIVFELYPVFIKIEKTE